MSTTTVNLSSQRRSAARLLGRIDFAAAMAIPIGEARAVANTFASSIAGTATAVLTTPPDSNPKLFKSSTVLGRPTVGLSLLPGTELGAILDEACIPPTDALGAAVLAAYRGVDACVHATDGCRSACLNRSGHGIFSSTIAGRAYRAALLLAHPLHFVRLLVHELGAWSRKFAKLGVSGAVRLNVISDHAWATICPELCSWILEAFGPGSLYDYTKNPQAAYHNAARALGYDLSLSVGDVSQADRYLSLVDAGTVNRLVAVVGVRAKKVAGAYPPIPATFFGRRAVTGDEHDHRPSDGTGVVVLLRVKDVYNASTVAAALASGFAFDAAAV